MEPYSMKISIPYWSRGAYTRLLSLVFVICALSAVSTVNAATTPPVLISDSVSTRAIAFESVTQKPGPFGLAATTPFGADTRTRVTIFAMNLNLLAGETTNGNPTSFTADAEDAAPRNYPMNIEHVD